MIKLIAKRLLVMAIILLVTCEIGLRIRLAYLYKSPEWLLYHQFRFRTEEEINSEDMPHYYKKNMFKPFKLIYREEEESSEKRILTVESSALRSIRRQLELLVKENPSLSWSSASPDMKKEIEFTNNDIVLYVLLIYPDIHNTLKRESRVLKKILGATLDDFLYNNLAFYMHIGENINFTTLNSDEMLDNYLRLLESREAPFCREIREKGYGNIIYLITPNRFDKFSSGGRIYLKYVKAAHDTAIEILDSYGVRYIDLMNEKVSRDDFTDYFHFSPKGGKRMSFKVLEYLKNEGLAHVI